MFDRGIYGFPSSDVDVAHGAALSCLSCWARDEVCDLSTVGRLSSGVIAFSTPGVGGYIVPLEKVSPRTIYPRVYSRAYCPPDNTPSDIMSHRTCIAVYK